MRQEEAVSGQWSGLQALLARGCVVPLVRATQDQNTGAVRPSSAHPVGAVREPPPTRAPALSFCAQVVILSASEESTRLRIDDCRLRI